MLSLYIYINDEQRGKGKHIVRAVEAINLGFATDHNMSAYKFFVPETLKLMLCNQAKFDELYFPHSKQKIIDQNKEDHLTNILRLEPSIFWSEMGPLRQVSTVEPV